MKKTENEDILENTQAAEDLEPEEQEESAAETLEAELVVDTAYEEEHERFLRLAAEYDNFRKRSQKERESLYTEAQADTVSKFLGVFDNLERAVNQPCSDEAYAKGVEMIMSGFRETLTKLGVTEFGEVGDSFDPTRHSAVMHTEDENLGESVIAEVFQKGFILGERVVRFAVVKVAN